MAGGYPISCGASRRGYAFRYGISVDVNEDRSCYESYLRYYEARITQDVILLVDVRVSSSVQGSPMFPYDPTLGRIQKS
jgi:hypothetical protein